MIRNAQYADIASVCAALRDLNTESPYYNDYLADETYVRMQLEAMIENPDVHLQVDETDGVIRGFMLGAFGANWFCPEIEANEALLYVFKPFRGTRTAVALIRAFEQEAINHNAVRINVGAGLGIMDERVEQLYERLGYTRRAHGLSKRILHV